MKQVDKILGEFLAAVMRRMKELGLNQTSLAKRLNVARPYVTKMLGGQVNISFGAAYRLARALEMDFCPSLARKSKRNPRCMPAGPRGNAAAPHCTPSDLRGN